MPTAPDFLTQSLDQAEAETFRPWIGSRRGEAIAWGCALVLGVLLVFLFRRGEPLPCMGMGLFAFLVLAAATMSFSNWLERNTFIEVDRDAVTYASPIRNARLEWKHIERLAAAKTGTSWRILVSGDEGYFQYRTEGVVGGGTRSPLQIGVRDGERLTALIRGRADLGPAEFEQEMWVCHRRDS